MPAMPVISVIESLTVREHREKVVDAPMSAFALVARPVGIEERKRTPAAWAASAAQGSEVAGMKLKLGR